MLKRTLALPALLVALSSLAACGGNDKSSDTTSDSAATTSDGSKAPSVTCDYPDAGPVPDKEVQKPSTDAPKLGQVPITITTSAGVLKVTLDSDATPCTVNSFRSLAEQGYFDNTNCHRLTTPMSGISVLQCGDPTGSGMGGPGYTIPDELTGNETYGPGTLAMAKTEDPNSGGSQFFIVYGDSQLSPDYTVFGKLDAASIKIVQAIGAKGTDTGAPDGAPKEPVTIESVR
jgi:peptidyl-prolyl cis-trans isomerase B (cyclophilin B)